MRALVVMKSVEPTSIKPEIFSIGGYSAVSPDGRSFSFDWDMHEGYVEFENGHFIIKSYLKEWSDVYSRQNDEQGVTDGELTAEFITKSVLEEVTYECYQSLPDELAGKYIPLEVVSFTIEDNHGEASFPEEEIARFNVALRKYEAENFPQASGE